VGIGRQVRQRAIGPRGYRGRRCRQTVQRRKADFRFDTFGDEAFWGDTLKLHQAIQGSALGGVGGGLSPKAALGLGLKVDAAVVPADLAAQIKSGQLSLLDSANTVALIKLNAESPAPGGTAHGGSGYCSYGAAKLGSGQVRCGVGAGRQGCQRRRQFGPIHFKPIAPPTNITGRRRWPAFSLIRQAVITTTHDLPPWIVSWITTTAARVWGSRAKTEAT
jgi:hypothetical protein